MLLRSIAVGRKVQSPCRLLFQSIGKARGMGTSAVVVWMMAADCHETMRSEGSVLVVALQAVSHSRVLDEEISQKTAQ